MTLQHTAIEAKRRYDVWVIPYVEAIWRQYRGQAKRRNGARKIKRDGAVRGCGRAFVYVWGAGVWRKSMRRGEGEKRIDRLLEDQQARNRRRMEVVGI
jgi:hypothetical protein